MNTDKKKDEIRAPGAEVRRAVLRFFALAAPE
jgi:hypothetical protein